MHFDIFIHVSDTSMNVYIYTRFANVYKIGDMLQFGTDSEYSRELVGI